MKILITGAHFTPAVAVIEELKKQPDIDIVYVGRRTTQEGDSSPSAESQILPKLGVKYIPIITGRLQRSFTIYTIPSLLKIPIGFLMAFFIILIERPNVILSFGGYVAVPTIIIGWLFSIPIIVHEQTLVAGLANKISSIFADEIALSFNQENEFDKSKTLVTGNPVREMIKSNLGDLGQFKEIFQISKKENLPIILVTGGNQGSHTINKSIEGVLEKLTKLACIIHITGENKFKDFEKLESMGTFQGKYVVRKWIGQEYGAIVKKVDLVISRAGINTLSELALIGKPALVIPFQPLYKDEQMKNAKFFQDHGLVRILPQSKLSADELLKIIKQMLADLGQLKQTAKNAKKTILPDAAKRLALEVLLLAK